MNGREDGRPSSPSGTSTPTPPPPPRYQNTPNAEKYVLEADAMRQRQLRSALLHGSDRTWREHRRTWPAIIVGLIAVALICGGLTIKDAFRIESERKAREEAERQEQVREQEQAEREREQDEREREAEEQQREQQSSPGPSSPTATAPGSVPTTTVPVP